MARLVGPKDMFARAAGVGAGAGAGAGVGPGDMSAAARRSTTARDVESDRIGPVGLAQLGRRASGIGRRPALRRSTPGAEP